MNHMREPRVAYVHEWLTEWGGSEDVVRAMMQAVPASELFATIDFLSEAQRARLGGPPARTTFIQRLPWARTRFWNYLPLTPLAVETHDARAADIVVSSAHACAKGVLTTGEQLHVSYVHSPMRYAWDLHHQYLHDYGLDRGLKGLLARAVFHYLRQWDRQTANNVDLFLANSHHVRRRIWRAYRRPARVLYPPVRTAQWQLQPHKEGHYVTVSRLVSYKRVDLIVEAFRRMPQRQLVVVGDGPERARLARDLPPNVQLLGWQPDAVVQAQLGAARAFVFAAHEDFGISPVEAQACGTPVIALGIGGACETVRDLGSVPEPTGVLFPEQTVDSLIAGVERFEQAGAVFDPQACRAWAETFSEARFQSEYALLLDEAWSLWRQDPTQLEARLIAPAGLST